jgi:hypothetical protein
MTIRQYVKRRFWDLLLIILPCYAALQLIAVCAQYWPEVFASGPWKYALESAPLIWVVIAWFTVKFVRVPCPRCSKPMGGAALAVVVGIEAIKGCPHCHVSFDASVNP